MTALEHGLDHVRAAPRDVGTVELIVSRPATDAREVLEEGELSPEVGLVGDNWAARTGEEHPPPDTQIGIMNVRYAELIAQGRDRWPLAGDQLYVDLDLSTENLPPGTQLALGTALLEVTEQLHTGCGKFSSRFGADALRLVNTPEGRELRLRGMYAKVVEAGTVSVGDKIRKL